MPPQWFGLLTALLSFALLVDSACLAEMESGSIYGRNQSLEPSTTEFKKDSLSIVYCKIQIFTENWADGHSISVAKVDLPQPRHVVSCRVILGNSQIYLLAFPLPFVPSASFPYIILFFRGFLFRVHFCLGLASTCALFRIPTMTKTKFDTFLVNLPRE